MKFIRSSAEVFIPRSPARDQRSDELRAREVLKTLQRAQADLQREIGGLRARYETAQTNASMYIGRLEAEGEERGANGRLDDWERSFRYFESRMRELEAQNAVIDQLVELAGRITRPTASSES